MFRAEQINVKEKNQSLLDKVATILFYCRLDLSVNWRYHRNCLGCHSIDHLDSSCSDPDLSLLQTKEVCQHSTNSKKEERAAMTSTF